MLLKSAFFDTSRVIALVDRVSHELYAGNLTCDAREDGRTHDGRAKIRWTLATRDSFAPGSRTAASGRHMPKASWQAHRDVMRALFMLDPEAELATGLATYRGLRDFNERFEATGDHNVGSRMEPRSIRDTAV